MAREFTATTARRERVPMLVGLIGPSGSGKTFSALRLATGMARVTGGKVFVVDTEARRALHYADDFDFEHVEFTAPFSPMDYLEVIEFCAEDRNSILIVDSMSHEHEGPGGVLEMHDAEVDRMSKGDAAKAMRMQIPAWSKPKAQRRKLLNGILRMGVNAIFCFRAKEKIKIVSGKNPIALGWQPIAGEEFVYEMTINCLLYPNGDGVPVWDPDEKAERSMLKLPKKLANVFKAGEALSEDVGEALANWASGKKAVENSGGGPDLNDALGWIEMAATKDELKNAMDQIKRDVIASLGPEDVETIRGVAGIRFKKFQEKGEG